MATGTEAVVARLFWALGYYVPETHVTTLRPDELTISEEARITPPSGQRRRFKESDIRRLLRRAHRNADGTYRVLASKALTGRPVGPFRFYGVRSDDPNDLIPHEHRRELRAYGTFAAWLNHVDSKSINTLDTVIEQDGRKVVRHHLLDFGSTIGSAGVYPREPYEGAEYLVEGKKTLAGIPSFGFYVKDWRTVPAVPCAIRRRISHRQPAVGSREMETPVRQFSVPSGAARRQVLGRTTAASVHRRHTQRRDPRWPVQRSAIGGDALEVLERAQERHRAPLPAGGEPDRRPPPEFFRDLDVHECRRCGRHSSPPAEYIVTWSRFDNGSGATTDVGTTRASEPSVGRPRICRPVRTVTSGSRFPQLVVRRAGCSQHMPISGDNQMAGNSSVSSGCPAAIRQEAKAQSRASDSRGEHWRQAHT